MMMQPQPMMMQQPMMYPQQQQQPAGPTIIINKNEDEFNCPKCNKGNLLETQQWGCLTCILLFTFPCALCLCRDCAYSKKKVCSNTGCGYEESVWVWIKHSTNLNKLSFKINQFCTWIEWEFQTSYSSTCKYLQYLKW